MSGIYLGLGTNMDDRQINLTRCIRALALNKEMQLVNISSVYESEPYGFSQQPWFLNMVVEIKTALTPFQLLEVTQQIEQQIGRKFTFRWGPRKIDIDILSYGNIILQHPKLCLPHRQLHLRQFVLVPLNEIAACYVHPIFNMRIDQLLINCPDRGIVKRFMGSNELLNGSK